MQELQCRNCVRLCNVACIFAGIVVLCRIALRMCRVVMGDAICIHGGEDVRMSLRNRNMLISSH